jgi:outer membrane protein assembly factor BamB
MSTYATGPRATPTVDDGLVYVLGAKGKLLCLEAESGGVRWEKDLRKDYVTDIPVWGMVAAPLVEGETLISLVGGRDNAKVVAYNKRSGKELWRSLSSETGLGYSPPLAIDVRGQRQIIIWHPQGVASLDPATGKLIWEQPFKVEAGLTVATPVRYASFLLLSSFYNGSMLLNVVSPSVQPQVIWKGKSQSEIETDSLHSLISTPIIQGDYIYGVCSYGQFRCLELKTGARVWETLQVTKEKARWATAFIVQNGDRLFINNDRGELVIGKVSPKEFTELSRTQLIKPTSLPGNRRELSAVNWSHPAYANRHIFARNDEEVICASLERE